MTNREVAFLYLCEQTGATDEEMNEQLELLEQKGYITTMRGALWQVSTEVLYVRTKGRTSFFRLLRSIGRTT